MITATKTTWDISIKFGVDIMLTWYFIVGVMGKCGVMAATVTPFSQERATVSSERTLHVHQGKGLTLF